MMGGFSVGVRLGNMYTTLLRRIGRERRDDHVGFEEADAARGVVLGEVIRCRS